MIHYITGNLFDSDAQALVNTVNTQGVMGKGIALQFKQRYPSNYHQYREACKKGEVVVGKMYVTADSDLTHGQRLIVNFPTKEQWRLPSQYAYIEEGLKDLRRVILSRNIRSIAIPPLGSSNGGLDWNNVKPMIEAALHDIDCRILIYEPNQRILDHVKKEKARLTPARAMLLSVMADMTIDEEYPSEFAAEKIAYFLQKFGAEDQLRLRFKRGYYGPYSGKVRYVLLYLNGSYLMGMSDLSNRPFDRFWLTADAAQAADAFLSEKGNEKFKAISERTKNFLRGYYSNYLLELLATTSFLLDTDQTLHDADENGKVVAIGADLAKWSNRKEQLFNKETSIRLALRHLKELPPHTCSAGYLG